VASQPKPSWNPKHFVRFERALATSMRTAQIVTDEGKAYCKALGNPEGPHALACEWVGTQLARWLRLPTFDFGLIQIGAADEIPFSSGGRASPGPAFVTRAERGHTWGGSSKELTRIDNPADVAGLVVLDTWTLNCDRNAPADMHRSPNYDNVFLSAERSCRGRFQLVAMDHTHCFTCGKPLTARIASIDRVKDERVFGLFPGFVRIVQEHRSELRAVVERLRHFDRAISLGIVGTIPEAWSVGNAAREALCDLISGRAAYVADTIEQGLAAKCWPQGELEF
jgi:hypothetical protein